MLTYQKTPFYKVLYSSEVIIIAVFFEILWMLGFFLEHHNDCSRIYFVLYAAQLAIVLDVIIALIIYYLDNYNPKSQLHSNNKIIVLNKSNCFVLFSTIIFIFWVPYVIFCFPGNIYYDSGTSIMYFLGIDRSNVNNPPFQNIIFGLIYLIGDKIQNINLTIFIYCMTQMLMYIGGISWGLKKMFEKGIPIKFIMFIVLLYGLCPAFPLFAFSMGKDSNFAIVFLIFIMLIYEIIDEKNYMFSKKRILIFALASIIPGLLRNATYLIIVFTLLMLCFVKGKGIKNSVIIGIILLVVISNVGLPKVVGVPKTDIAEVLSVPLQQTAYYISNYKNEISDSEKKAINKVIPYNDLFKYNPDISDPIKQCFNNNATNSEIKSYFIVWYKQLLKHPVGYLKATVLGTYAYYCPPVDKTDIKIHAAIGYNVDKRVLDNTNLEKNGNKLLRYAQEIDAAFTNLPFIGLFSKIGIYSWALIFAVIYMLRRKEYTNIVCLAPLILLFIMCLMSPVNGYFRYAFNMILSIPIIIPLAVFIEKIETNIIEYKKYIN